MSRVTKVSKRVRGDQLVLLTAERRTEQLARLVAGSGAAASLPQVLTDEIVRSTYDEAGLKVLNVEPARRYHGAEGPGAFHYWLAAAG